MTKKQNLSSKQILRRNQLHQGLVVAVTLILVSLLCLYLYQYDNQYTTSSLQPSNGVLDLRDAPLDEKSPPYHIQKDWEFYPDVLLTPNDDFSLYPHRLCSLHESSKELWESQGTFRLTILLPDTPMSYALKIPSSLSMYRFYVNQDLILSTSQQRITNNTSEFFKDNILTVFGSGEAQLLIQYVDELGIYSGLNGLSAPPILGRPLGVYALAEDHFFFLSASVILILLTLLLSISVYHRSWQGTNLAMIVLCLSAAAYLAHPLVSSKSLFPLSPWYQMAILFYFSCHAATHWAYSLYFGWNDRAARFVNWYSTVAVGLCALLLLASSRLQGEHFFYYGIRLLQWGAILCGIALTLHIIISGEPYKLMGAASVALWSFLLIDLLTPDFSPITFARFTEMGIICLMDISILVEYLDAAAAHRFRLLYAQKISHAEQFLKSEERHYAQLASHVEDARRIRHDLRQHLRVMRVLLDRGDSAALSAYLEQYTENVKPMLTNPLMFYQVPIVDTIVAYYWSAARKQGADFLVKGQLQELPQSVSVDFCSIMGNLLENALESIERQPPDQPKWIRVRCESLQDKLMLEVVNSNSTPVQQHTDNRFQSAKRDDTGMGTFSVSMIAQQYGGLAFSLPRMANLLLRYSSRYPISTVKRTLKTHPWVK